MKVWCKDCGNTTADHFESCKWHTGVKMKRSTTEDYPPLGLSSALRDAAEAADAQLQRDIEAARGVKPEVTEQNIMSTMASGLSALERQEGGDHYKGRAIQPIEYIHANGLGFIEGSIVKYITRWRDKGGQGDLLKIKHYVDLLIDLEGKQEVNPAPVVDDGWVKWPGGENPVGSAIVQVRHRSWYVAKIPMTAHRYDWCHKGWPSDIVAYRVV